VRAEGDSPNGLSRGQTIKEEELLECIKELVRLDKDWVPQGKGYSLYLRPCMIATQVRPHPPKPLQRED
jgi:hypothetical protein